ncbi:hypothetical protein COT50_02060, partial [candidate division WWE3 bacterium CG08_land_8_20_14_0_20_41_10]
MLPSWSKNTFLHFILFTLLLVMNINIIPPIQLAQAQEISPIVVSETPRSVTLYFFWGNGCPHCEAEEKFLKMLQKDYPTLTIRKFEVWGSAKNREIFKQVGQKLGADVKGVPFTVIGGKYIGGYYTDDTTGAEIRDYVASCVQSACVDAISNVVPAVPTPKPPTSPSNPWADAPKSLPKEVTFPLIGKINLT